MAPEISATVMMAKVAWNPTKARPGRSGLIAPSLPIPRKLCEQDEAVERVAEEVRDERRAERESVAVQHPEDADEAHGAEAHHHHLMTLFALTMPP